MDTVVWIQRIIDKILFLFDIAQSLASRFRII